MISVASIMRGEPTDFHTNSDVPSEKQVIHDGSPTCPVKDYHRDSYYANYEMFSTFTPDDHERLGMPFPFYADVDDEIEIEHNKDKNEIGKMDNQDLKLRYYLGGLQEVGKEKGNACICNYWSCDINCSCFPVPDDERLVEVKKYIKQHNLTNEDFLRLSYAYLTGSIMKYRGTYSPLFIELDKVLLPYNFSIKKYREIPDNDFREKELEKIVNDSTIKDFCIKHQLSITDFIALAKTSVNYRFLSLGGLVNFDNKFGKELSDIIKSYNLYLPLEEVEKYREEYKRKKQIAELIIDARCAQKKYLELMKELLIREPTLTSEMISEELNELGFTSRKDVKRLVLQKDKSHGMFW